MAKRRKKAWGPSNPLYRYLHGGKKATKTARRRNSRGGNMGRKKSGGKRQFGAQNSLVRDLFVGMGAAAATKRFVGAPLGSFTGAAAGAATSFLLRGNLLGGVAGGFIHDNIGNIGGASGSSGWSF